LRENMRSLLVLLVLLSSFCGFAEESKEKDRLAVMDVQDKDSLFNQKTRGNITDYIFGKLAGTKLYWMIPKSDRDTALEQTIEKTRQDSRKECVDEKCQLSLVAELQANFLINTEIKKLFESTCLISIKKFDVEKRAGTDAFESKFNCTEKGAYEALDSLNLGGKRENAAFITGKMGKLEEEWNPDMAGSGEQAVIYFESDPQGATVSIDENVVGKTPDFKSKMLASGKHQIKMEKEGFYIETKILDLKKGTSVKFKLFPAITINSDPTGAVVRIDGKMVCQSTPCDKVIEEGECEITVQKELYLTKKQIVSVQRGNNIQIDLEPNFGRLEIESPYDGVDVVLDGKNIGKTPIQEMQITPGAHIVEPQGECFNTVQEQFVVEKSKTYTVKLAVQQKEAAIQIVAKDEKGNDIEASVFVDGKEIGMAPGMFKVPLCSKEVVITSNTGKYKEILSLEEKQIFQLNAKIDSDSEMSIIPAGWFWMGCSIGAYGCNYDESPRHKVQLDEFKIDKKEVTIGEYEKCVDAGKCESSGKRCTYNLNDTDFPVYCVNWYQAKAYCEWQGKRLPTDAEWEKAARGGTNTIYYCGNDSSCLDEIAWYKNNSGDSIHPVGKKSPNAYGLYDMLGNVWEWVNDWYSDSYYGGSPDKNPQGPDGGDSRILRGGGASGWLSDPDYLSSSYKCKNYPKDGWEHDGFRCAKSTK